jgi:hypothetical protein
MPVKYAPMQKLLSEAQHAAFYHDEFVELQSRQFEALGARALAGDSLVLDVGGGEGHFARALKGRMGARVRVLDADPKAVAACIAAGLDAQVGDALAPAPTGEEQVVCFNLILHHLVGETDRITQALQVQALAAWRGTARAVFVNEYIYDSWLGDASGWLIYRITSSRLLSAVGSFVARFVPSLKANTFGVGVRFRSHESWTRVFAGLGYRIQAYARGIEEQVSLPRRLLLIKSCRKDCYLLVPNSGA